MTDRILVVGAGAVGVSYAHVLTRGGAEVSFYVRPRRVAETREGLTLWEVPTRGRAIAHEVRAAEVLCTPDEVRDRDFSQVWLTVPSPALAEPWLDSLCAAAPGAAIVSLSPGLQDRERVAEAADADRVVAGLIVLVAWHDALPGEEGLGPGVRAWFPPLVATPFSGPRAPEAAAAMKRGGVKTRVVEDAAAQSAPGAAMLQTGIAGLECAGWSLRGFARGEHLRRALDAGRQAAAIAAAQHGRGVPASFALARPALVRTGLGIAPRVFPADLETYLRVHFTKVGAQTTRALAEYVDRGEALGLPTSAVAALADELAAVRRRG